LLTPGAFLTPNALLKKYNKWPFCRRSKRAIVKEKINLKNTIFTPGALLNAPGVRK